MKMQDLFFADVINLTNCISQAWHWKWENTISPDSYSRLGSDVDSKNAIQL